MLLVALSLPHIISFMCDMDLLFCKTLVITASMMFENRQLRVRTDFFSENCWSRVHMPDSYPLDLSVKNLSKG
jgi:hypothetical protein